jgi:hypothetical protein
MRLYRKDKGVCTGREPHDHVVVSGPVKRLKGCLHHYTYDDLSDQIATQNRFSTISSKSIFEEPRRFSGLDLVFRPMFRFFKGYILKRGFLDGYRGFIIATLIAIGVFFKYAKLWELTFIKKTDPAGGKHPAGGNGSAATGQAASQSASNNCQPATKG